MTGTLDKVIEYARRKGREDGATAASWFFSDEATERTYQRVIQGIEDGDPEIMDDLPQPDLSGQWADGLTGPELFREACEHAGLDPEEWLEAGFGDVCNAYEDAFLETVEHQIAKEAMTRLAMA